MTFETDDTDVGSGDLITEMAEKMAVEVNRRLEREVAGAWMAGYDYLHVGKQLPSFDGETFGFSYTYHPSDHEEPPSALSRQTTVETYDLRWLFPQDLIAYKTGDFGGEDA